MELWDTRGVGKESQKVAIVEEDGRRWLASKEDKEKEKGVSKRSKGDEMRGNKENKHGTRQQGEQETRENRKLGREGDLVFGLELFVLN